MTQLVGNTEGLRPSVQPLPTKTPGNSRVRQIVPTEWARDLADYVDCHRAVGTIDLSELVGELSEHRKRILRDVEVLKQRAEFCKMLERMFNEEQ
jgi:hypothetical protein